MDDENNVNKEQSSDKMSTYAKVAAGNSSENGTDSSDTPFGSFSIVKPIFILEEDVFGNRMRNDAFPKQNLYLLHEEVYTAIGKQINSYSIRGLQRVNRMWRIYLDSDKNKQILLSEGIVLRGKKVNLYTRNPRVEEHEPESIRVRVKNIPLSADDGEIRFTLENLGCKIINLYRERLRISGLLTNCLNGDRIVFVSHLKLHFLVQPKLENTVQNYIIMDNQKQNTTKNVQSVSKKDIQSTAVQMTGYADPVD